MDKLFLRIEEAEPAEDVTASLAEAIAELSKNPTATIVLLNELQQAAVDAEILWREIEQSAEFKAKYHNREQACADYWRAVCKD